MFSENNPVVEGEFIYRCIRMVYSETFRTKDGVYGTTVNCFYSINVFRFSRARSSDDSDYRSCT